MVVSALNAHLWIFNFLVDATFFPQTGEELLCKIWNYIKRVPHGLFAFYPTSYFLKEDYYD